jgi:amidophosphoribosyltransferase
LFDFGINRARDPLRSFMRPSQSQRDGEIGLKHFADPAVVKGRRVGVGDDTLVRGTTAKRIVKMLRDAGATEVHFLIFAPLIRHACPLGGMENKELGLLKGRTHTPEKLRDHIQADSLNILSRDAFERVINAHGHTCCTGCIGGSFPPGISEAVLK